MNGVCECPRTFHQHGTRGRYLIHRCRCFDCRIGNSRALAGHSRGLPIAEHDWASAAGVARRLQALYAVGWSWQRIASDMGVTLQAARRLATEPRDRCMRSVYARVVAVYEDLSMRQPPFQTADEKRSVTVSRNKSHAAGWLPPLAWDDDTIDDPDAKPYSGTPARFRHPVDEVAVTEAMAGRRVTLTKAEHAEAVHRLTAAGYSAREIADRLGTNTRLVNRRRAAA